MATLRLGLVLGLLALASPSLWANVSITSPTGGNNISADKALNSTNGAAFTALGNIVIAEGLASDFAAGTSQTLILAPPTGWQFNPGVGTVTFGSKGNITAASLAVTSSSATITLTVNGTSALDTLTISGLQVQALNGSNLAGDYIRTAYPNPGTEVIAGIDTYSTFGLLNLVAGTAKALRMQTQPGATSTAGALFAPQPAVQLVDQFGNMLSLDSSTVVTAALASGTGPLQGSLKVTDVFGVATYTNLSVNVAGTITLQFSATNLASVTSTPIVVGPAPAQYLVFATQPGSASTGVPFSIQPVIKTQDRFGSFSTVGLPASQLVTVTLSAGSGILLGTTTLDIGTAAGNGTVSFTNLEIDAAGTNKQLTAASLGLTNAVSASFSVSSALYKQLQVLLPGEIAAPGTTTGKTGTPNPQAAGTPFNVTVNAVDANWNLVNTIVDNVGITASDIRANLPANAALVSGTKTFSVTFNTVGTATVTATDLTDGTKLPNTSSATTVGGGTPKQLALQTPPSATATAGVPFATQPVIAVEDAGGNLVATDNGRVITVARGLGTGTLQGTLTATTVNGLATFTNLSYNLAQTITLNFTASGLTNVSSGNVVVGTGPFAKLQLLVPGQSAAPGTTNGFTGTPSPGTAGTAFNVTVNAVDALWNLITNATDNIAISSTDTNALLPASTALVNGTGSFSLTFKTAGSQTLTASDLTDGSKSPATSTALSVNPGAFVKLQLLAPGEAAVPGSIAGKSGTPTAQTAGTGFALTVNAVDANWNLISTNDTVSITSSDANATLPPNTPLSGGTKIFSVTNKTAGSWTYTASDVTHTGITAYTSAPISLNAGTFVKLQLLMPGEGAAPGTTIGKAGTPTAQMAGTAFNLTVNAVDANWNVVGTVTDIAAITSSDTNASLPLSTALVAGTQTFSVTLRTAGTRTLTASDATDGTKTASTSPALTVNPGAFVGLQLLMPGQTSAPGTATGSTGTPAAQTAGTAFNVTVSAVDAWWNQVTSVTHTVGVTSTDTAATLPANAALVSGTKAFSLTLRTAGPQTVTATDITDSTKTSNTSPGISVTPGSPTKLVIQTQPSATATAGVAFAQQPVIYVTDSSGNLVNTNGLVITAARGAGSGTLQGTLAASTVNGIAAFGNLSHNVATTITVNFTASGLTSATSGNIVVSPAAFTQLQLLMPGETSAPGTSSGKTGAPSAQSAYTSLRVTVNAVDAFWNPINTVTDTVGLSSSDATATLPPYTVLAAGTTNLPLSFNTNGSFTVTATDLSNGTKSASTSPAITVSPAQFTQVIGGSAIPADGATGTFSNLSGPSYSENASSNASPGTIILNAPGGFIFDTGGTAPTVLITRLSGTANNSANINAVASGTAVGMSSVTSNQLSFTITRSSTNGVTCKLTWQNIRVRPTAGTPLASGTLKESGTANLVGLSTNSNLGTLREVAGSAKNLAIQTQPSATATAGVPFVQQPVLQVRDQFGNLRSSTNGVSDSTLVAVARGAGSGTLQGSLTTTANNGIATFINLSHNVATNITLAFSASGLTGTNSSTIAVAPAAASQLVFATQPGSSTYGSALSPQPVLQTLDAFGNSSTVGLGTSQLVTLSLSAGTGALQGTTSLDIGTAAGNGLASFSGLSVNAAGTGKQLSATSTGLASATSSTFAVNVATVSASVTANNKIYDGTTAATIATSTVIGVLPGDSVSLSGGTAVFSSKTAGTNKTVTVSGLSLSGPSAANYQLASTSATTTANITTRSLTVSATATNKVYDGTTTATVSLSDNRVAGDSLTDTYTSATFPDKNVATAKPVSVSGIALSGTDAGNYQLAATTATASANISARSLTVTATGVNKVYDATTTASVTLSDNRVAGDNLTNAYTGANFSDKNAGTGKTVTVSGITISGTDAANYSANSTASTTANITARSLTVSATGVNKVYDATTNATVTLADNRLSGDSLTENYTKASFADKNVGTAKPVTVNGISLSGSDASNYTANATAGATADITARSLTVTATGLNKVYDATTAATVTLSDNRVSGDSLTDTYTSATFADKNVGTNKPVSVSGISISGTDATNYQLSSTTTNTTANISVATLTAQVSASNKVYDGTTAATISTNSLNGVLGSDNVSLAGGSASFADKKVGTNKTVTVAGLSLAGTDVANYQLGSSSTSTSASITARSLTVSAAGVDKVYDATTNATVTLSDNRVSGDSLTEAYTSATFADKNIGTTKPVSVSGITISGTDASNYTANATASTTATITARSLSVSAAGVNKLYDATTNAAVTLTDNRLAGDSLTDAYTSASFANKNVGTNKPVTVSGIAISGTDALNYTANSATNTTATITAKGLTVSGITASNKVYDATTTATLNTSSATLSGVISGDSVSLNSGSASGVFADKNAGTAKTVTVSALSLSGTDAGNYSLTQPTTTANITQAPLTVTANNQTRAAGQANPTLTASYTGFAGGETLATSGVTGSPALSTTTTNVAGNYPITAAIGTLSALNYSFSFVNGTLTVTPASPSTLVIVTQPSSSAIAGVPFAQQPAIGIQDAYGNLLNTNGLVVSVVRGAGTGTLQGTLTASTLNGVATFANLSHNVANTINLSFSSGGLTNITSANILVGPAAFTRLQLLVPGQTSAPGTTNGFSGSPTVQIAGSGFPVTVNAVDAFYNLVNTVTDLTGITSSDLAATLPANAALVAGTQSFNVALNTSGSASLTASDLTDGTKTLSTSPTITVKPAQYTSATGGAAISADSAATSTFTALTGPTYTENNAGNVGTGTIILNAPIGFVFDTGGTAPTVKITSGGSSVRNINGVSSGTAVAMTSVTSTQLTFTVTSTSNSGVTNTLTWQNIRVRPTAGTPLASGSVKESGTANVVGLSTNSSLGILREIAGSAKNLAIQTQPSASATAGVPFAQQPVLQVRDQFGNLRSSANGVSDSTMVTAARGSGSGTLQGSLSVTATNGLATFTNLSHNVATNITLSFSASGLTGTNSSNIAVGPAAASQLVFATQPGNGTVGVPLATQPALITRDQFGNNSAVGLGPSKNVTVTLSAGSGPLQGAATLDIGSSAGNGAVAFTNLSVGSAGTNQQLTASAVGLSSAASSFFSVIKNSQSITFGALPNQVYGNAPFTVSATASSGLPVTFSIVSGPATIVANTVTMTGVGTVTVQAAQAGNTAWAAAAPVIQGFTVAKATLTVTAENKSRVYGTTNPPLTTSYTGYVNGENASVLSGSPSLSTTAAMGSSVPGGPYPITVTQGTLNAANYSFIFVPGALTITKAPLTVTAVNQVRTYGAPNPALTLSYSGFMNGDNASVLSGSPTLSTTATAVSPVAGSPYAITVTPGSLTAANYYFTFVNGNLSVLPAALAVSAADASRAYGRTNPVFSGTLTGVQNGDNITASYNTTATNASPVGTYPIVPTLADPDGMLANYTVASTNGTLTVFAAELVGTVANQSRPYGQANSAFTVQYSGFVNGDDQSVLSGQFVATTAATPSSPVGTYPINGAGQSASNYLVTYVSGTLTITSAALTVQANDASRLYGDPNPGFSGTLTGVQSGDNITASYTSAATVQSPVGTYAIVPTLSAPQGILSNYTVAVIDGTLTVTPAALALVANNATRPYGQTNPVFTGSVSGVRNGDNITATYTTGATVGSPVGTYDIVPSLSDPGGKLTNYTLSATNGKLTISPVTLTVTANSQSRVYGAPNPTLTASYSGFVAGDDASVLSGSPALSTTATASSSVAGGPYPITAALGSLSAVNYTFVFSAGQLSITPASSLIAVISSANPSLTGSNVMFTAALAGAGPSLLVPTGTVQFMADGAPLSAPVNVAGGSASLSIANLSHGIHTIGAGYGGDGNFFGTTNSLGSNQVVNIPPTATLASYTRGSNDWLQISVPDLLTNHTSDADGDPLTLVSVSSGTNGATVLLYEGSIYYLPSNTNPNADTTDYLDYAVTDGFPGGTVTNKIRIQLDPPLPPLPTPSTLTQISCGAGTFTLTFNGSAITTYRVQRAAALQSSGTVWTNIGSATTDSAGHGQFTDTNPPPCQGYYRTVSP